MEPQFFQTGYGKMFFESQLPGLIKAINRLSDAIEKQNELAKEEKMINEKIELRMPNGTKLIAETEKNIDYPAINITHIDENGNYDTVAFAEYNPSKPFGQRLCAGASQNNEEDTKFYGCFCHCIRPNFSELDELYRDYPEEKYIYQICDGYIEIKASSDGTVVYRVFAYNNENDHAGHNIRLSKYEKSGKAVNYSFECFDCNEVIYSADKYVSQSIDSEVEFEIKDITDDECYKTPSENYLDYVECECWNLFKQYAEFVGVKFGDGIDFQIAKEISEKIMATVERTFGIEFPISKNRRMKNG